jgi:uncharacterized integral membrane protein (TIGR00697 family)
MNTGPSYKVMVPLVTLYTLCLFLPAIDMLATYTVHLFSCSLTFGLAALIFPAIYPLSDSITEVYGKKTAWYLVIACYIPAVIVSFLNNLLLSLASNHQLYDFLLKPSLAITIMGPVAYILTSWLNVKLINKLKMKMRGKHFSLRSFVCSGVSETITSLVVLPVVFYGQGMAYTLRLFLGSVLVKILITIPFVFVARLLVGLYRQIDGKNILPYNPDMMQQPCDEGYLQGLMARV